MLSQITKNFCLTEKQKKSMSIVKILKYVLMIVFLVIIQEQAFPQGKGLIIGKIIDSKTGEELIGANILLEGTNIGSSTDLNGNFEIKSVNSGTYTLIASMVGYSKLIVTEVDVKNNQSVKLDLTLTPEAIETDEVIVTARMLEDNEASLLKQRQKSNSISDAISSELISRSGSSNAADAMSKVTGASVVGGKYVFVRGLGERYSNTHLNGTELPSADPDKKSFNMDLFPSGVLENITTIKSFTPDKPGNFSGGIVDIATKSYPDKFTFKLSGSSSYNSATSLNENFLSYNGGGKDWLGMDDGSRNIPASVANPDVIIPSSSTARFNEEEAILLDEISKSFNSQMSPGQITAPVNQSYSLTMGDQIDLLNMPLGYLASFTYNREYSFYENGKSGRWKLSGNVNSVESLTELQFLNDSKGTDEVNWGGLITLNLKPDPRHEIGGDFIYTQSGQSAARFLEGRWDEQFNQNSNAVFQTRVLSYTERNLQSYQLHGKHFFESILGLSVNWSGSISTTSQIEPDTRYFTNHYSVQNIQGVDTLNYSITPSTYSLPSRYWRDMNEDGRTANLDLVLPFNVWSFRQSKLKIGGAFNEKERDFYERRFEYKLGDFSLGAPRYNGDPDYFFAPENVGVLWYDSTRNRYVFGSHIAETPDPRGGNYNGYEKVSALYSMIELPVTASLKFIGGARYEISKMEVYGKNSIGYLNNNDVLPSVNLIYLLTENMNIRSSYGKTLARPNFREKAPYANYNFAADFIFIGNPDLKRTLIDNYDIRWEWFLRPGEIIAVSGFYKFFKDPIERVINVQFVSEGGEVFYDNIDRAEVFGAEIEIRKRLDEILDVLSNFSIGTNVSLINSKVSIPAEELESIRAIDPDAKDTRQLQGQSPYIINLELSYDNMSTGTYASVFYNVFGDRLAEVSIGGTPDVFERSRPMFDFTISQNVFNNFNLRLSIKNLLNSPFKLSHEFKDAEYIRSEYRTGTSVSLGLNYSFN
jgi:outer membrane receptor protein involved in Fe transport